MPSLSSLLKKRQQAASDKNEVEERKALYELFNLYLIDGDVEKARHALRDAARIGGWA